MKKIYVYTMAYNKVRRSTEVTQGWLIDAASAYLKNAQMVIKRVYAVRGGMLKTAAKILKDIAQLLSLRCRVKLFFYPTIPLYPCTESKLLTAWIVYPVMFALGRVFGIKTAAFLIDMPVEQSNTLQKEPKPLTPFQKRFKRFEKYFIGRLDLLFDQGRFSALHDIPQSKVAYLRFTPCRANNECEPCARIDKERVNIFYSGDMTREYEDGFLKKLLSSVDFAGIGAALYICGDANESLKEAFERTDNVFYLGYITNEQCNYMAQQCDFGLMIYPSFGYYNYCSSTKFVTYAANGLPILSLDAVAIKENIEHWRVGEAVSEEHFESRLLHWITEKRFLEYAQSTADLVDALKENKVFEELNLINTLTGE